MLGQTQPFLWLAAAVGFAFAPPGLRAEEAPLLLVQVRGSHSAGDRMPAASIAHPAGVLSDCVSGKGRYTTIQSEWAARESPLGRERRSMA